MCHFSGVFMSNFKNTVSYIWPIVSKYKKYFYLIFVLVFFRVLLSNIINPVFYKQIIDLLEGGTTDRAALSGSLLNYVILIAATLVFSWFFSRSSDLLTSKFQASVIRDLHDFSFKKFQSHSYTFFANHFTGSLVNKSRKFVRAFEVMHDILMDNFWTSIIAISGMFVVFFTQAKLIAFLFLGMSIAYVLIIILMSKKRMKYEIAEAAADSKITGYLADSITNVLSTKASSAYQAEMNGFKKVTQDAHDLLLKTWLYGNKQNALQSLILIIVQILSALITAHLWLSGQISAGVFLLVQSYSVLINGHFWQLGRSITRFTKSMSDMKEMVDILREVPDVLDPENPEQPRIEKGNIEIKNITFNYSENGNVFKNFSLNVRPGEKVGLVGHSGSGKSTITKALMRFVDVTSGDVLIDGQDIRKITQDDLHRSISYISQDPILFHRSIKDNIAYGKTDAAEEEIFSAAKKAHAHEFITNLAVGYDTLVGERGVKLSGGERQRVAIARAMLKPAPILILDEATSSLDSISESYIQDAFSELMKGKTAIVIAHRLSTVQKMDRIILLEKGKVVEEGTHQELLRKNGFYADLWSHQTGGFLE